MKDSGLQGGETKDLAPGAGPAYHLQAVFSLWQRDEGSQWGCGASLSWAEWAKSLGRPNAVRITRTENTGRKTASQGKNPEDLQRVAPHPKSIQQRTDQDSQACEEMSKAQEKSFPRGLPRIVPGVHVGLGTVPVLTSQT